MEANLPSEEQRFCRKRQRKSLSFSLNQLRSNQSVETVDLTARELPFSDVQPLPNIRKYENPIKRARNEMDDPPEDLSAASRRSQPHRAARYTESYSNIAGLENVVVSDEEKKQNGGVEEEEEDDDEESSDSDVEIIPKSPIAPLTEEQQLDWENRVQTFQKNLRNEEIKLVLLKKLKESQSKKDHKKEEINSTVPPHVKLSQKGTARASASPSISSSSQSPIRKLMPTKKIAPIIAKSVPVAPVQQALPEDLTKAAKSGQSPSPNNLVTLHTENLSKSNISILPVNSKTSSTSQRQSQPMKNEVSISLVPTPKSAPQQPPPPVQHAKSEKDISAQQLVAKMALRKQLEKTLLQIPTPRPKVQKLRFVPNGSSPEFVWLFGLDIVVDFLTKAKPHSSGLKEPYSCHQCRRNFSETWNTVDDGGKRRRIVCQTCYSSNVKKSLKVEHTGYLKAAFVKALQQEKEIERLSQSISMSPVQATSSIATVHTPSIYSQPAPSKPVTSSSSSSSSSRTAAASPNLFLGNNSMFMQQFGKLTPQQIQAIFQAQAQSFMSANIPLPAHMVPFSPFFTQYPFHLMNKSGTNPNDLQRQYLLDMIPPRASSCAPVKRKR